MPYNRWGAKSCALCSDPWLSRTGVCIGCDAGMCRTFFHVTWYASNGDLWTIFFFLTFNYFVEVLNEKGCCRKHSTKMQFRPILFMPTVSCTPKRVPWGYSPFNFHFIVWIILTQLLLNWICLKQIGGGNRTTYHTNGIYSGGLVKETPVTIWWIRVAGKMFHCVVYYVN